MVLTRALVCSSGGVSACLNVVGPLSVAVVINQNLEHGGLQNLPIGTPITGVPATFILMTKHE